MFLDFPLDVVFAEGEGDVPRPPADPRRRARPGRGGRGRPRCSPGAERPAIIAGTDVYWDGAWDALRNVVETCACPTFANGLGRGCLPADHELAFSRTRSFLKTEADVVMVVGTPLDFRLSFGQFGDAADHPRRRQPGAARRARRGRGVARGRHRLDPRRHGRSGPETVATTSRGSPSLRDAESSAAAGELAGLQADSTPIKPTRVYGEVRQVPRPRRGRGVRRR